MKTIVGLGNPGDKYKNTRHNIGFELLDALARELGLTWTEDKKRNCQIAKNLNYLLVKPLSYMNLSGEPLRAILSYYNLIPKNYKIFQTKNADLSKSLVVVHDDLDIDFGKYKISVDSRSAGHNGVQSIINNLKTKNFQRVRMGIKNETMNFIPREKFVLQKFSQEELKSLVPIYREVIEFLQK